MKATVQARNAEGSYSMRTENDILLVFTVKGPESLAVGETVELDLPSVLASQQIVRMKDNRTIGIHLDPTDIHDLQVPAKHGTSRTPS